MLDTILTWLSDPGHLAELSVAASAICALTPTPPKDANNIGLTPLGKIYRIIEILALNIGKAKQR